MKKPPTAAGYTPEFTSKVRATCLYVATKLGDLIDDTVVVGGLVPSLIIDTPTDPHVGTTDLDVGLALAVFDNQRYQELAQRLRQADFGMDKNDAGNPTRQRWQIDGPPKVTVDFLIPPSLSSVRAVRSETSNRTSPRSLRRGSS